MLKVFMFDLFTTILIINILIIGFRMINSQNSYEKILSFYFIFSNFIFLIITQSITSFDSILDIIIMLFLLKIIATLFLLFNRKKI